MRKRLHCSKPEKSTAVKTRIRIRSRRHLPPPPTPEEFIRVCMQQVISSMKEEIFLRHCTNIYDSSDT